MTVEWQKMQDADLVDVSRIAAEVHPGFPEEDAIFAERLSLFPDGCQLLRVDGDASGYLFSHPVEFGKVPRLNSLLGEIAAGADSLYIHDLALLPQARGTGAAKQIVSQMSSWARTRGFASMSLVAVNESQRFWESQWFIVTNRPELAAKLQSYEPDARFMVRQLD